MPAPIALAPFAWKAAQIGAVAAVTWYVSRRGRTATEADPLREVWREQVLNDVAEGLEADVARTEGAARADAAGRLKRVFRVGSTGPGLEVDATILTRLRLRRV